MISATRLRAVRPWLALSLLAVGAACVTLLIFLWQDRDPRTREATDSTAPESYLSRPDGRAPHLALVRSNRSANPATQKPGPPSPIAQKSAAESADKAAHAAAELAAKTGLGN